MSEKFRTIFHDRVGVIYTGTQVSAHTYMYLVAYECLFS